MKKIVIALVLLLLVSGAVFAQDQEGPVRFDSSTGIYYDAYADVHLGDFLALRAYGGGICLGGIGSSMVFEVAPEAGARLSLAGRLHFLIIG